MEKALVIAEKPSVAADIAKALGGFKKDKDIYALINVAGVASMNLLLSIKIQSN